MPSAKSDPSKKGKTVDALASLLNAVPGQETLYHYTSQEGLLGIIQKRSLWVSSIRHLSDSSEFEYAVNLARTIVNGRLRHERGPWNSYYGEILKGFDVMRSLTLFVGCFSEKGNLLSQWRAYTPNGIGYSVGIKHKHLKSLATRQKFRLLRCSYSEIEQAQILNEIIDNAGKRVSVATGGDPQDAPEHFFISFFQCAPALKHPSFSEENEWRIVSEIVQPTDPATKFRPGKSMLIPYREFSLEEIDHRLPVSKIFVGPCPHPEQSLFSVTRLLFSHGITDCVVVDSEVPYRSW